MSTTMAIPAVTSSGQTVLILKEGSSQNRGKEAQRNNIAAAKLIAEIVKTSLGPRGMDKMLVDSLGDVTITNDGATMLKEIDVQHPAAKMLVEVSKTTDNEVGDGTTSAVVLAGALLEKAEELLDKNVHSTVIVDGYMKAAKKAVAALQEVAEKITPDSREWLVKVARTSMQTKVVSQEAQDLAEVVRGAVTAGAREQGNKNGVEYGKLKGIDDVAQHYLAKANVLAVRRAKESDMTKLAKATGARVVNNFEDLSEKDLGYAATVEERKVEEDKWVFVEGAKNPKAVTLLIRGGTQRIVDEAERSLHDAIMVTKDVIEKPAVVAGGGAAEAEAAYQVQKWAEKLSGREQLAAQKFAEALETIPVALAENAGMAPIDAQAAFRAKHAEGGKWFGIDAHEGKIKDMYLKQVFEPLAVKEQIIRSASEVASMILRIDDVIAAGKMKGGPPKGGGGGGGEDGGGGGEFD